MTTAMVDVIYIAGAGRSGSTMLELLLERHLPNSISVGEIRQVWTAGVTLNRRCGCGRAFADCDFWTSVLDEALEAAPADRATLGARSHREFPNRRIPAHLLGVAHHDPELLATTEQLYRAIAQQSGAERVIDASKLPAYAIGVSACEGVRLHVIHLVRDSRAVAFSWMRDKPRSRRRLKQRPPAQASRIWFTQNLFALTLRWTADSYMRLSYEDVAAQPQESVARILRWLSIAPPGADQRPDRPVREAHALMGNPMRHDTDKFAVRVDDEWRDQMPLTVGAAVTALTWPLLVLFRYPLRWRRT